MVVVILVIPYLVVVEALANLAFGWRGVRCSVFGKTVFGVRQCLCRFFMPNFQGRLPGDRQSFSDFFVTSCLRVRSSFDSGLEFPLQWGLFILKGTA